MNRLSQEKSPYLLQHAHNPVDWFPWGDDAFRKAREENKPVFLSIGYSSCHWCHVMERESFQDGNIARLLNENFVSVKVDREERPDIDHVYMQAVMLLSGGGGWPMTLFLTPDGKPFFAGTYFPPEPRRGSPGFKDLLASVRDIWQKEHGKADGVAEKITAALSDSGRAADESRSWPSGPEFFDEAFAALRANFDHKNGGFGTRPKFPQPHSLMFLLRFWKRSQNREALAMVNASLQRMARGGIYDHLGGGFHRYSTDAAWHLPHFEKMLYDQAMLSILAVEAYQVTGHLEYRRVAEETMGYVLRDLRGPDGAFYAAEDADSIPADSPGSGSREAPGKREGAFYLWEMREISACLSGEEQSYFCYHYGIQPSGNIAADSPPELQQKNILYAAHDVLQTAEHFKKRPEDVERVLHKAREKLRAVRETRPRPFRDDKVLADWNGLMVAALASAARILQEPEYARKAEEAAGFVLSRLRREDGRLLHRYRDGEAGILGMLDDYAFLAYGLLELYQATFRLEHLKSALTLAEEMVRLFADPQGGFFLSGQDAAPLIYRPKIVYDGATPSGNAIAILVLLRLAQIQSREDWQERAEQALAFLYPAVFQNPAAYPQVWTAWDYAFGPRQDVVLVGTPGEQGIQDMLRVFAQVFLPRAGVVLRPPEDADAGELLLLCPAAVGKHRLQNRPSAYVCQPPSCLEPVCAPEGLEAVLRALV